MSLYFLFVQFEFTHAVGPHAGRYVVEVLGDGARPPAVEHLSALEARNRDAGGVTRDIGDADVLVVGVVPARATKFRILRRARPADGAAPPAEVPLSVITYVKGTNPIREQREVERLLEVLRMSEDNQRPWVDEGLAVLNLAIRAYRAGAHDPYAIEVTRRDARRIRIGYGTTEQVQNGLWQSAIELAEPARPRTSRVERLRPTEAVATVLAGRGAVLDSEDLMLRALVDLDNNRTRAAAFQLGAAMRLLPRELGSDGPDLRPLEQHVRRAFELEEVAGAGSLDDGQVADLEAAIAAVDRVLEAWRYERAAD